jgi:hypothetical protein
LLPLASSQPLPDLLSTIREAQARDPFLATVSKGVRLSDDGIWRDFFYVGEDDAKVLCYQRASDARPRVCVPKECRAMVLRAAHGEPLSGHSDIARTVAVVSGSYYWPTLYADVAHFVRTCPACNAAKSSSQARFGVESFATVLDEPFSH